MPVYAYECKVCGGQFDRYVHYTTSENPPCSCGGAVEKIWKITKHTPASAFPFVTRNIDPSGKPIEVQSALHMAELCKRYGVEHRPDAGWVDKEYLGVDFRTGKQKYKEGSGVGNPGCWF